VNVRLDEENGKFEDDKYFRFKISASGCKCALAGEIWIVIEMLFYTFLYDS